MADERSSPPPRSAAWQKDTAGAWGKRGASKPGRARRIFTVLAVMAALAGALVAVLLIFRKPREPFLLSLPITEYKAPFAPNPLAQQDGDALLLDLPGGNLATSSQGQDQMRRQLEELAQPHHQDHAVLVHLSSLAVTRGDKICLLGADARPESQANWLPLDDVLDALQKCPSPRKMLLLDIMHPLADARLGVLTDDVAARTQEYLEKQDKAGELPCPILCACGKGQFSLPWEEMEQTVFGYYVDEGLHGYAAGYDKDKKRLSVTAYGLAEFIKARVARWARENRDVAQVPVIYYGKGEDFVLLTVEEPKPHERTPRSWEPFPKWQTDWERRDAWLNKGAFASAPRAFREYEALLLWAERYWRGGRSAERIEKEIRKDLESCSSQIEKASVQRSSSPLRTLALARKDLPTDPAAPAAKEFLAAREAIQGYFRLLDRALPETNEQVKAARDKTEQLFRDKPSTLSLLCALFDVAVEDNLPTADKFKFLGDLLQAFRPPQPQPYIELLLLQRLAEFKVHPRWAKAAQNALIAVGEAEKAVCTLDPRALRWVQTQVEAADRKRWEAEARLFSEEAHKSRMEAAKELARQLEALVPEYQAIPAQGSAIRDAYRTVDRAYAELPGFVPYLVNTSDANDLRPWKEAIAETLALSTALDQGPSGGRSAQELADRAANLGQQLDELNRPFGKITVEKLIGTARQGTDRAVYRRLLLLLDSPRLQAKQRAEVWKAARELAQKLQQRTLEQDRADNDSKGQTNAGAGGESVPVGEERKRGERRARLALDLFELAGLFEGKPGLKSRFDQFFEKATHPPHADADWEHLGDEIRLGWSRMLPERLHDKTLSLAAADRLNRGVYPLDAELVQSQEGANFNPAAELRRSVAKEFWTWLGERYLREGESLPPTAAGQATDYREIYREIGEEYKNFSP